MLYHDTLPFFGGCFQQSIPQNQTCWSTSQSCWKRNLQLSYREPCLERNRKKQNILPLKKGTPLCIQYLFSVYLLSYSQYIFLRKTQILAERKKVLANLRETQKTLESKKEELEQAKIKELEEKLANARRKYGDMKVHLVIYCALWGIHFASFKSLFLCCRKIQ